MRLFSNHVNDREHEPYCLKERYREGVTLLQHDVRDDPPDGPFDLVLCRNPVFMYFGGGGSRNRAEKASSRQGTLKDFDRLPEYQKDGLVKAAPIAFKPMNIVINKR